jgi:polysaccharide biosynthesis protein PslH
VKLSRILFLSQLVPFPPDSGPKVRSYYVLRYLAQHHDVVLVCLSRKQDSQAGIDHLRTFCREVHPVPIERSRWRDIQNLTSSLFTGSPFIIQRDFVPELAALLKDLVSQQHFDFVHADQLWMAQYASLVKSLSPSIHSVLDEHNACFQIFQRLAQNEKNPLKRILLEREWRLMRAYEKNTCASSDDILTVTEDDKQTLLGLFAPAARIALANRMENIPICVDIDESSRFVKSPKGRSVLYVGTMFYLPNVEGMQWFLQEVWPLVLREIGDATLTVVGKNPPQKLQEMGASSAFAGSVQFTGFVPDLLPYFETASVFIVPLLSGGGMRVKIVDAWRWQTAIISTRVGAEGLQIRDGENILIVDDPASFARGLIELFKEPQLAERLGRNGRIWVEQHYDWKKIYPLWDRIYPKD